MVISDEWIFVENVDSLKSNNINFRERLISGR
jgi:hypothetical protein